MTKIRAVVFDFDGTITRPYFDFGLIKDEIGMPRDQLILEYVRDKDEDFKKRVDEILYKWELKAARESELNDHVSEVLEFLQKNGIRTGVLTRNKMETVKIVLEKFPIRFDYIHTRDSEPIKPHPDSMHAVLNELGAAAEDSITIGDYEHDIVCGRSVGTKTMYITNGNGADGLTVKPDYIIHDFSEGLEIIRTLV